MKNHRILGDKDRFHPHFPVQGILRLQAKNKNCFGEQKIRNKNTKQEDCRKFKRKKNLITHLFKIRMIAQEKEIDKTVPFPVEKKSPPVSRKKRSNGNYDRWGVKTRQHSSYLLPALYYIFIILFLGFSVEFTKLPLTASQYKRAQYGKIGNLLLFFLKLSNRQFLSLHNSVQLLALDESDETSCSTYHHNNPTTMSNQNMPPVL